MNRKGFTLIELLATIVIIGVIGGIASYGVISAIDKSKLKSEEVFVEKLSNLIDDYLDLYPTTVEKVVTYTFDKCKDDACTNSYEVTANKSNEIIQISDLVDANIISYEDLVNPKNKKQCFDNSVYNPEIVVYKDSDYVYHYYVDLSNNKCELSDTNKLINNMPKKLVETLNSNGVSLPSILKSKVGL